jgi:hypothetical protein
MVPADMIFAAAPAACKLLIGVFSIRDEVILDSSA